MPMDPAYLGLAIPLLLFVLWYFERKRQREQRHDAEQLEEEIAAAVPSRQLEALLLGGHDEAKPARGESFRNFLHGAPTRKLTADWFVGVYLLLLSFLGLGGLAVLIIGDAVKNLALRNILIAMVAAVALVAWALRIHAARRRDKIEARLRRVLQAHGLVCAAVIDSSWHVNGTAGDFAALSSDRLPHALLGCHGEAMTTYRALAEMPLPQVIVAGSDVAIADKPAKHIAVVAFARGFGVGANLEAIAANVSATIRAEFTPNRRHTLRTG